MDIRPNVAFSVLGGANASGPKTCQDCIFVDQAWQGKYGLYIVADGHGGDGHIAAGIATEVLPGAIAHALDTSFPKWRSIDVSSPAIARQKTIATSFCNAMKTAFAVAHAAVDKSVSAFGGSTCVVCIRMGRLIVTASCGDSRAVLALHGDPEAASPRQDLPRRPGPGLGWGEDDFSGKDGFSHDIIALTVEHTPSNQNEYTRIAKAGGFIASTSSHGPNAPGPLRVWRGPGPPRAGDVGLAMTRSIGDRHLKASGVICDPVVSLQWAPRRTHATLVLGSDGIFDVLPLPQVVAITTDTTAPSASSQLRHDATKLFRRSAGAPLPTGPDRYTPGIAHDSAAGVTAAGRLVMAARTRWELLSPHRIDDISAIVISVPPGQSRASKRSRHAAKHPSMALPTPAAAAAAAAATASTAAPLGARARVPAENRPIEGLRHAGSIQPAAAAPVAATAGAGAATRPAASGSGLSTELRAPTPQWVTAAGEQAGAGAQPTAETSPTDSATPDVGLPRTRRSPFRVGSNLSGQIQTTSDLTASSLHSMCASRTESAASASATDDVNSTVPSTVQSASMPGPRSRLDGSVELDTVPSGPSSRQGSESGQDGEKSTGPVGGFMRAVHRRFGRQRKIIPGGEPHNDNLPPPVLSLGSVGQ